MFHASPRTAELFHRRQEVGESCGEFIYGGGIGPEDFDTRGECESSVGIRSERKVLTTNVQEEHSENKTIRTRNDEEVHTWRAKIWLVKWWRRLRGKKFCE